MRTGIVRVGRNTERRHDGFTLIELMIVVAIIGILAAIAIPNLLTAMQRSKQKRTMADIRTIATAWEARATDENTYLVSGATFTWPNTAATYSTLGGKLAPTYIKALPQKDGWSRAYGFAHSSDGQQYAIRSQGKDGVFGGTITVGGVTNFDCDIVYSNGSFIQYAEGVQQ